MEVEFVRYGPIQGSCGEPALMIAVALEEADLCR